MPFLVDDVAPYALAIGLPIGLVYAGSATRRRRSRRAHADVERSGRGSWLGRILGEDLERFIPGIRIGPIKGSFLSEGVPVQLDIDHQGLRLRIVSRLLKRYADRDWFAPWGDVVEGRLEPAGFSTLGGKISTVRVTDAAVLVVGESAQTFLESWELGPDGAKADGAAAVHDDDPDWLKMVSEELGPMWQPGTALLRIRMSAVDGLDEVIQRSARGRRP